MYTEEYEHKGFPIRDFLLRLVLVVLFVFLLVWLLPKFINPTTIVKNDSKDGNGSNSKNTVVDVSGVSSQIFLDNLDRMKEAAISYYTNERLPQNVGDSKQMTLSDMIGEKIISPLIDRNNKAVNVEKSYVKITKLDEEYLLKVNLKDSEKEDYILVHLGCYDYCNGSTLCEKNGSYDNVAIKGSKDDSTSNKVVSITPSTTTKVVEGTHKSSSSSSSKNHSSNKHSSSSSSSSGKPASSSSSSQDGKPAESTGSGSSTNKYAYLYEYKKTTGTSFSSWTSWSNWSKTNCSTREIDCNDKDTSCLKELQRFDRKEQIGSHDAKYTKTRQVLKQTGSYQVKACSNYNYVIVNNTTYATTTTTTYSTINQVSYKTQSNVCGSSCSWTYAGRASYKNPPIDTATTHYVFAGADYSYCAETCTTLPNYYYDKYIFNGYSSSTKVKVVTPGETTSSSTTKVTSNSTISVAANCGAYVTKTVPIYGTITVNEIATRREPLYGTVCYQSTRTRSLKSQGSTRIKWSHYDDRSLLNDGWFYTGNKKVA